MSVPKMLGALVGTSTSAILEESRQTSTWHGHFHFTYVCSGSFSGVQGWGGGRGEP